MWPAVTSAVIAKGVLSLAATKDITRAGDRIAQSSLIVSIFMLAGTMALVIALVRIPIRALGRGAAISAEADDRLANIG